MKFALPPQGSPGVPLRVIQHQAKTPPSSGEAGRRSGLDIDGTES
jgi:hypothetical protein